MQTAEQCHEIKFISNHERLKSKSKAAHHKVDQQLISLIKKNAHQPYQMYSLFLNLMLQFWDSTFGTDDWHCRHALLEDIHALPIKTDPSLWKTRHTGDPSRAQAKLITLSCAYLFWGSAMGSKPLKSLFTRMLAPAKESSLVTPLPQFLYLTTLISEHSVYWASTTSSIRQLSDQELNKVIDLVNYYFEKFAGLISVASQSHAIQSPLFTDENREAHGE